jgi:hypothetical protein
MIETIGHVLARGTESMVDLRGTLAQVGPEERTGHDRQGQPHHLFGYVERTVGLGVRFPAVEHLERFAGHDLAEGVNTLAVEDRLY